MPAQPALEAGIGVFAGHRPCAVERVEPAQISQLRVAQQLAPQGGDAGMLEHEAGDQRVPHRAHRIIVATVPASGFQQLHQRLVGERVEHQHQAFEITQLVDAVPAEQKRMWYSGHRRFSCCEVVFTCHCGELQENRQLFCRQTVAMYHWSLGRRSRRAFRDQQVVGQEISPPACSSPALDLTHAQLPRSRGKEKIAHFYLTARLELTDKAISSSWIQTIVIDPEAQGAPFVRNHLVNSRRRGLLHGPWGALCGRRATSPLYRQPLLGQHHPRFAASQRGSPVSGIVDDRGPRTIQFHVQRTSGHGVIPDRW